MLWAKIGHYYSRRELLISRWLLYCNYAPVVMTTMMNFLLLSFGQKSEAKFIKTQVFTSSSVYGASPAGAAAASSPHGWRKHSTQRYKNWTLNTVVWDFKKEITTVSNSSQCLCLLTWMAAAVPVKSNSTVALVWDSPPLTSRPTEKGRDESEWAV